ncbi:hypothetical protein TEK04_14505 [Klenkia sp. LSe6-5]|uniref:DNA-directed RNA polymerase specialized sigma subunit, sigma24 family n=1 Tax=Klenkia sesuvii TaxID=3103137 RepID=A0ABU8DVU7_9ACTN
MDVGAVVRRHRDPLLAVAHLLEPAGRTAEDRVDRALAHLSPAADHGTAVRALLSTRLARGGLADQDGDPWWLSPADLAAADRTAAALAELDADARAALVLDHEGLPADPVALARARIGAPEADLGALAAVRRPPVLDHDAAVARVRTLRAWRWRRPAAVVAAVAVLVALAVVSLRTPNAPAPAAGRLDAPTRGSLAADTAFVEAARAADWDDDDAPAVPDRHVLLAGDLLDRRWVLVTGPTDRGTEGQWSTAPQGAPAADLVPAGRPVVLRPDVPPALLLDTALVVMAGPGEGVEVSSGLVVGPSGGVQRVYRTLDARDGVTAMSLAAPDPGLAALRVRVVRVGEFSGRTLADVPVTTAGSADAQARAPALTPLRGSTPDLGDRQAAVDDALAAVAVPTGLDPRTLAPVLLWAGQLPAPVGGPVDAVVLAVPLPGGAVVVSTAWADRRPDGSLRTGGCGSRAFPAGTGPADLASAARCVVADRGTGTARVTVVVTGPGGSALVPDDTRTLGQVDGVPVTAAGPDDLFAD